jgi:hypothetical protein
MNSQSPWDKLPDESSKAYSLFCLYRDMGPTRSLTKMLQADTKEAPKIGKRQLVRYSSKYNWVRRSEAFDLAMEKRKRMAMQDTIEELACRQAEAGFKLSRKGLEKVNKLKPKELTPAEARMYIIDGSELERIAHGLTDERKSREPRTIKVIISAPRPGDPLSEAPQRRELSAGNTADGEILEGEAIEVNKEEFA